MQRGSLKSEGLILKTKIDDLKGLSLVKIALKNKYNIDSTILSQPCEGEVIKVLCITKKYIPLLH